MVRNDLLWSFLGQLGPHLAQSLPLSLSGQVTPSGISKVSLKSFLGSESLGKVRLRRWWATRGLGMTAMNRASCQPHGGILRTVFSNCPLWLLQAREEFISLA